MEAKKKNVIIGSRESKLAVIQSELVRDYIEKHNESVGASLLKMKTTGDIILDRSLDKIGGKGLFVKELDKALLDGRSELSVHSLKDMPMEISEELPIIAYSKREDPRDVLVLPKGETEFHLDRPVGCSSQRRMLQLKELYPLVQFKGVRGNVLTRLNKLDSGEYSALILAAAGLKRLGLTERISRYFEPEEMIPAAGQGILAVQGKMENDYSYLDGYDDMSGRYAAICERSFVTYLNGGCSSPIAAYAKIEGEKIILQGLYYNEETRRYKKGSLVAHVSEAKNLGIALAKKLQEECKKG